MDAQNTVSDLQPREVQTCVLHSTRPTLKQRCVEYEYGALLLNLSNHLKDGEHGLPVRGACARLPSMVAYGRVRVLALALLVLLVPKERCSVCLVHGLQKRIVGPFVCAPQYLRAFGGHPLPSCKEQ
jgi:hypothetical protein